MRPLATALAALVAVTSAQAQTSAHPLDGLSPSEYWAVYEVLHASGKLDSTAKLLYVGLNEPPKAEVLAWKAGQPFRREAFVHLVQSKQGHEAVVDLAGRKVLAWRDTPGRQYMAHEAESQAISELMLARPDVQAALAKRGIKDLTHVFCFPANHGYLDSPEERGHRLARVACQDGRGSVSGWGSPIEGLQAVADLQEQKIVRVTDTGVRPRAGLIGEHHDEAIGPARKPLLPLVVSEPLGHNYTVDGGQVSWDNWRFHFRVDARRGLVLSQVGYVDGGRQRSILYQASLSELFVPYMDPAEPWNYQGFYDLGTYPAQFSGIASRLDEGRDCPANATYFDTWVVGDHGGPKETQRAACLFERQGTEPAWRHDRDEGVTESRVRRDLVLRMIMNAGNYDYLFDWVFMQDGTIKVNVGATGMDQVKGALARSAAEQGASRDDLYGRFIAPYLVGVNHTHLFSFRLDFDVDGPANSLMVDRLETERLPAANPRRSLWHVNTLEARTESDAKRHSPMNAPELWRIVNPSVKGAYGDPVGYMIAGHGVMSLLAPDDMMRRRAGFTDYNLWVTPQSADELYAAGNYPTVGPAGQGLPDWTRANRPIANTDLVAWYTLGFHHVPRPEDWPMMPMEIHGFELKPVGFFNRNPAIDLPRQQP